MLLYYWLIILVLNLGDDTLSVNGIFYKNTQTNILRWVDNLHEEQALGYAYETDSHFVHLYGKNYGFNVVFVGLTAIEGKSGTLNDWVIRVFGAQDIKPVRLPIGSSIENITILYTGYS